MQYRAIFSGDEVAAWRVPCVRICARMQAGFNGDNLLYLWVHQRINVLLSVLRKYYERALV